MAVSILLFASGVGTALPRLLSSFLTFALLMFLFRFPFLRLLLLLIRAAFENLYYSARCLLLTRKVTLSPGIVMHGMEHIAHQAPPPENIALYAAAFSLVLKEALYHLTMRVAKKERSDVRHSTPSLINLTLLSIGDRFHGARWTDLLEYPPESLCENGASEFVKTGCPVTFFSRLVDPWHESLFILPFHSSWKRMPGTTDPTPSPPWSPSLVSLAKCGASPTLILLRVRPPFNFHSLHPLLPVFLSLFQFIRCLIILVVAAV